MQVSGSKIGGKEKFAYLLANIGNIPLMSLTSSFLLIFYTNVVGLNPAAVATLFLISRILDGINDPVMTDDEIERTTLSTLKGAGYILGTVVITFAAFYPITKERLAEQTRQLRDLRASGEAAE